MTLYQLYVTYIMPHLVDLSLYEGFGSEVFYKVFAVAVAVVITHFVVIVPYRLILKLCGYKPWRLKR